MVAAMAVLAPYRTARSVIDAGDTESLRKLLAAEPGAADKPVRTGSGDELPPIAYVISLVRAGRLGRDTATRLSDILLEGGASPSIQINDLGDTLLIHAAHNGCETIALRLLSAGADPHVSGKFGATALHWAAQEGLLTLVEHLLASGMDPKARDRQWRGDALYWAIYGWVGRRALVRGGQPAVIHLLREGGLSPSGRHEVLMTLDDDGAIREALGKTPSEA
jgi:hypothetical protein